MGCCAILLAVAVLYLFIPSEPLFYRQASVTLRNAQVYRHNRTVDGGCSQAPSSTIRVHEQCLMGGGCEWAYELRGPTANLSLRFSAGHNVLVTCAGQGCFPPVAQSWPRLPYNQYKVEVLPFPASPLDVPTSRSATDGAAQVALALAAGWAASPLPLQQTYQLTPNSCLDGGTVTLMGSVTGSAATIATLPVAHRPPARLIWNLPTDAGPRRIDVLPTGEVTLHGAAPPRWLFLNAIRYRVSGGEPLGLQPPWSAYARGYQAPTWHRQGQWVVLSGVLANATRAGPIATLPPGSAPPAPRTFTVRGDLGPVQVAIGADGGVRWESGAAAEWLSLDGVAFDLRPGLALATAEAADPDPHWPPQLHNGSDGRVALSGRVRVPGNGTALVATIPPPYRPPVQIRAFVTGDASVHVTLSPSGALTVPPGFAGQWVSLSGIAYATDCWQPVGLQVGDARDARSGWQLRHGPYDMWSRNGTTLEECKAVCRQLRCRSITHDQDGHCVVKARDLRTAPPRAHAPVARPQVAYTYACPAPDDRPAWLSPVFARRHPGQLPALSLVTPHGGFTDARVTGPVAWCFWDPEQRQAFPVDLLPRSRGLADAVVGMTAAVAALLCFGAGCRLYARRARRAWGRWLPRLLFHGAAALWLLAWAGQVLLWGHVEGLRRSLAFAPPPLEGYMLLTLIPCLLAAVPVGYVLVLAGVSPALPSSGAGRIVGTHAALGLFGAVITIGKASLLRQTLSGQDITEYNYASISSPLVFSVYVAAVVGATAWVQFRPEFAIAVTALIAVLMSVLTIADHRVFDCTMCLGHFVANVLWNGIVFGLANATVVSLLWTAARATPDDAWVAGMLLQWRWSSRASLEPLQARTGTRRRRAVTRLVQWYKSSTFQKAGGALLTGMGLVAGVVVMYVAQTLYAPRIAVAWNQLMLEYSDPFGVLLMMLYPFATMLLLGGVVAAAARFEHWLSASFVFLPQAAACMVLLVVSCYTGLAGALLGNMVDQIVALQTAGQLVMLNLYDGGRAQVQNGAVRCNVVWFGVVWGGA